MKQTLRGELSFDFETFYSFCVVQNKNSITFVQCFSLLLKVTISDPRKDDLYHFTIDLDTGDSEYIDLPNNEVTGHIPKPKIPKEVVEHLSDRNADLLQLPSQGFR